MSVHLFLPLIENRHAMLVNDVNGWVGGGGRVPFWQLGEGGREVVGVVARFHIVFLEMWNGKRNALLDGHVHMNSVLSFG